MYPLAISIVGAALLAFWLAYAQPRDMETLNQARADTMAANFWTYRDSLVAFQNANFASTQGFIPDAALSVPLPNRPTGYFPLGYAVMQSGTPAVNLWKNYFEGGRLYTYSTIAAANLPTGVIDAIANRNGRSLMVGVKQANGTVVSMFRLNTPPNTGGIFTLPAALAVVPDGAVVVIGN